MNTVEKYFIYRETIHNNQLNDKHTIHPNPIFENLARIRPHKGYSPPPRNSPTDLQTAGRHQSRASHQTMCIIATDHLYQESTQCK
jgi:hypothetical protein